MVALTMFLFPSVSATDSGYGCVASSGNSSWWTLNCPSDLVERIKEAHANDEMVYDVSVASNGDWFFSTSGFNTAKTFDDVSKSRVAKFCRLATNGGVKTDISNVSWITFMPGEEGFIGVSVANGVQNCYYERIPQSLETHLLSNSKIPRSVSVGYDNSWIVVYHDGSSTWRGIPDALAKKLRVGYSSAVESVILSPKTRDEFIVNYANGACCYVLPVAWGPAIARQEELLQELTARLTIINNAANTNSMAAASSASYSAGLNALALDAAFAAQSWGIF